MVQTLTDPHSVSVEILQKNEWSVRTLIKKAVESPDFNCLIDAGALITGMSNEEVARCLLKYASDRYR